MGRSSLIGAIGLGVAGLAVAGALLLWPQGDGSDGTAAFTAPGLDPMTVETARANFFDLTPALLLVVYEAFARTDEDEIYDTLARVTDGEALEYLYLERVGAMAGGGLDEADQTIHEIKLLNAQVRNEARALAVDASWQVIGTVGHAEHLHVRGNTYSADLTIAPVADAWKITGFTLRDVNRDAAGETFLAPQTN
ncbi:hypothetical protein [Pseudoponticoccus marisrubri]|uniref:Uncharacterized protein n=1 Tax=Pseudoponticoccus marisrubri TaxID=1685382 RepID=A0A0W7WI81_9RHOB|nr:hypothetical protein [Pseudoponticoccus marisrubri]KUF10241.1 hypothetical protein AVJ23_12580 [Pseudoponticoccus marisrubri]